MCLLESMSSTVPLPLMGRLIRVCKLKYSDFSLRIDRFESLDDVLGTWTEIQDWVMRHTSSLLSRLFLWLLWNWNAWVMKKHITILRCVVLKTSENYALCTALIENGIIRAGTNGQGALGILKLTFALISQMTYIPESTHCCPTERTQVSYLIFMS